MCVCVGVWVVYVHACVCDHVQMLGELPFRVDNE